MFPAHYLRKLKNLVKAVHTLPFETPIQSIVSIYCHGLKIYKCRAETGLPLQFKHFPDTSPNHCSSKKSLLERRAKCLHFIEAFFFKSPNRRNIFTASANEKMVTRIVGKIVCCGCALATGATATCAGATQTNGLKVSALVTEAPSGAHNHALPPTHFRPPIASISRDVGVQQ